LGLESWIRDKSDSKNSSHRVRDKVIRKFCNINSGEAVIYINPL
jgi:hypothetical protein